MFREGSFAPGLVTIRVFYPNPLPGSYGNSDCPEAIDKISKLYNVTYLWKNDPIYHELVFADEFNVRHQIIGLAYHMEEKLESHGGIDVEA